MAAHPKFKIWLNRELYIRGLADEPDTGIPRSHLKVEGRRNGEWVRID